MGVARRHVGQHADHALAAQRQQRNDLVIVAGVDVQILPAGGGDLRHLADVAAGFLHCVDVRVLGKLRQTGGGQVAAGAAGDIVQNAGQVHGIRNGGVVGDQTGLAGLVVVGGDQQQGVGAVRLRLTAEPDGVPGIVGAGARNDRNPPGSLFDGVADARGMLLIRHGGGLAGGAADDNGIGAVVDLVVNDAPQLLEIHAAVGTHGGDDRHGGAGKNGLLHREHSFKNQSK